MNVKPGDYIMWFTRYGSTESHVVDDLEECFELADMLENAESCVFDQWGCLGDVEIAGQGVISGDEWYRGLAEFQAKRAREYEARRAVTKDEPKPIGAVYVFPPAGRNRTYGGGHFASGYSVDDLESKRAQAAKLFGEDRVSVRMYKTNN